MKLAFIILNMVGGGAEEVLFRLLYYIAKSQTEYDIHLLIVKKEGLLLDSLNDKIKIFDFNKAHVRSSLFDIINYLK